MHDIADQSSVSESTKTKTRTRRRILIAGGITIGLIVVLAGFAWSYVNGLLGLIDRGEVPGDSTFYATEWDEPEATTTASSATSTGTGPSETEPSVAETTVEPTPEPTIDPRISDAQAQQLAALDIPLRKDSQVYNVLLIGSDRREGETTGRSDAMIILSINKRTHKIHLVSLMRALYVNIPGHGFYLLNGAYSYGGSKLLRQTIEENLRVKIDDYVMIDFSGFKAAIDQVGGLDITLTAREADYLNNSYGTALIEGSNHLDGTLALAYARIRKLDSDFVRTSRQRKVIESLIQKMMTMSPGELDATARTVLPLVKTNMSNSRIISLLTGALDYHDYPVKQLMLPIKNSYETMIVNRMEVVKFDFAANIEALQKTLYDD